MRNTNLENEFKVFIPLINLLLFDTTETPSFENNIENLDEEYLFAYNFYKKEDPDNDEYFRCNINYFINNTEAEEREKIANILANNEAIIATMQLKNIFENKNTKINDFNNVSSELMFFVFQGKISDIIYLSLLLLVEDIFSYNFSDSKIISKEEYNSLIQNLCFNKKLLNF